jgi:cytoskeletal protein CcmA (bactofilin family)|tara:strand:- start:977 stop:1396 length:420 start_codon:yes stop_codon:yes gene_type:complete
MIGKKNSANFEAPDRLNRFVEGTKLIGELITETSIRIDGEIQGNVNCAGKVLIGENAVIKGNLICSEADVEGTINGDIKVDGLLVLREKARVKGNIDTSKIEIHQGAIFIGNCVMAGVKSNNKSAPIKSSTEHPEDIVY